MSFTVKPDSGGLLVTEKAIFVPLLCPAGKYNVEVKLTNSVDKMWDTFSTVVNVIVPL
jgi:hypothetical protein